MKSVNVKTMSTRLVRTSVLPHKITKRSSDSITTKRVRYQRISMRANMNTTRINRTRATLLVGRNDNVVARVSNDALITMVNLFHLGTKRRSTNRFCHTTRIVTGVLLTILIMVRQHFKRYVVHQLINTNTGIGRTIARPKLFTTRLKNNAIL